MSLTSESPGQGADPEELAHGIALRLLTARARTQGEIVEAFRRRNVPEEASAAVLARLTEVGLIDDAEFARSWVASRQHRRNLSRTVLRQELRGKGIAEEVIADAVAEISADDEFNAARVLAEKKARSMRGLDATVQRRRLAAAMGRRGFAAGVVASVLRDLDLDGRDEADSV